MRRSIWTLFLITASYAQVTITATGTITNDDAGGTTIFDCGTGGTAFFYSASSSSANCVVANSNSIPNGFNVVGPPYPDFSVDSGVVNLTPSGDGGHTGVGMTYQQQVNVQAFTVTITFIPNGKNLAFVVQNDTTNHYGQGFNGRNFSAGAGCEAGFYQAFDDDSPTNIFAIELDSFSPLYNSIPDGMWPEFSYSSAMIYSYRQSPCIPPYDPSWSNPSPAQTVPTKISTSPVPLNSPAGSVSTTTGHLYSATITYSGTNVKLDLYDITAGGACPGASCFSKTWTGIDIPTLVGANTAWVGITAGCNYDCTARANVHSFKYVDN